MFIERISPCPKFHLGPSKFSRSNTRIVVCQCEPFLTPVILIFIGTRRIGAGVGIRFTPNLVSYILKKIHENSNKCWRQRQDSNLAEIQAVEANRINGQEYIALIERRVK